MRNFTLIVSIFLLIYIKLVGQQQTTHVIPGRITEDYAVWDTTNMLFANKISEGMKGDSCIIFGSVKSTTGAIWYRVATIDTIGYVSADYIYYDTYRHKVNPLRSYTTINTWQNYFTKNKNEWVNERDKAKNEALIISEKKSEEFKKFISKSDLLILSHAFPKSEYLKYPGFQTTIVNPKQNKIIKYIWFTITAFNAVDDIEGTKTVKGIGPVHPLKTADYDFELVFTSKVVDYCKIVGIKIHYTDGSNMSFNKDQVETILVRSIVFKEYLKNN